jgi:6-phosphogluconolactonase
MSVKPGVDLRVLDDADAVAHAAADMLVAAAKAGGQIALSGGSTPKRAYRLAAEALQDWSNARLWLGDERHVPADDERSTARMVHEQLLDRLPEGGRPDFEPVRTDLPLEQAANDYEVRLRGALRDGAGLDLALMGLGPDSHTASLFPGKPAVGERERWVVEVPEAGMEPYVPRVTMTLPVFDHARLVVFLIAGEEKADAVVRAFGDPPDPSSPSAHVSPLTGKLVILADRAAAARLTDRR